MKYVKKPLVLVGAVLKDDTVVKPAAETRIEEGDEVRSTGRVLSVPVGDGLLGRRGLHDGARGHDVTHADRTETQQVIDDVEFLLLEHAVLRADVRHGEEVAPGEGTPDLVFLQRPGQVLAEPDQRAEQPDDPRQ